MLKIRQTWFRTSLASPMHWKGYFTKSVSATTKALSARHLTANDREPKIPNCAYLADQRNVVFILFHSPLQMDSASVLLHCSMSWLQLSTIPSSWDLSHETPRKRANCSTNVPESWRGEERRGDERWCLFENPRASLRWRGKKRLANEWMNPDVSSKNTQTVPLSSKTQNHIQMGDQSTKTLRVKWSWCLSYPLSSLSLRIKPTF